MEGGEGGGLEWSGVDGRRGVKEDEKGRERRRGSREARERREGEPEGGRKGA